MAAIAFDLANRCDLVGGLIDPLIPNALARAYRDAPWLFLPYVLRGISDILTVVLPPLPWPCSFMV